MHKLYTIGHSNRSLDVFLSLLDENQITHLIDIRAIPKSRRLPWFNQNALATSLTEKNINYTHIPQLGGRRQTNNQSINLGWRNKSFRGFADYMQTPAFLMGLDALNSIVQQIDTACIMCAEALPWQCHRSLIADAEMIRGITVVNILNKKSLKPHSLTPFAVVEKDKTPIKIYYPEKNFTLDL